MTVGIGPVKFSTVKKDLADLFRSTHCFRFLVYLFCGALFRAKIWRGCRIRMSPAEVIEEKVAIQSLSVTENKKNQKHKKDILHKYHLHFQSACSRIIVNNK